MDEPVDAVNAILFELIKIGVKISSYHQATHCGVHYFRFQATTEQVTTICNALRQCYKLHTKWLSAACHEFPDFLEYTLHVNPDPNAMKELVLRLQRIPWRADEFEIT